MPAVKKRRGWIVVGENEEPNDKGIHPIKVGHTLFLDELSAYKIFNSVPGVRLKEVIEVTWDDPA